MSFAVQFENLKKLDLPVGDFMVVSSGALAVRGIRESGDLDVVVTESLWKILSEKYPVVSEDGIDRIDLGNDIEILSPADSIFGNGKMIPLKESFEKADTFDGIKFMNLEHLKKIKEKLGREKDLRDIQLIDEYLNI
jgi:hypothetical protein